VYNTKIKRVYNVNGNGMIHGEDKLYYKSGKIQAIQKWNNGRIVHTTAYFETGALEYVKNYKDRKYEFSEKEEPAGEQKFYDYKDGKHYQYMYLNILDNEVVEFKYFDINGKITEQYKKDAYLNLEDGNFTIKNGNLTGTGLYFPGVYSIDIKDGKLLNVEYAKNSFSQNDFIYYFEVLFKENYIKRTVVGNSSYYKFTLKPTPFSVTNNKSVPITVNYVKRSGFDAVDIKPNIENLISTQLENTVMDSLLTITDFEGKIKEKRYYENGLLIWKEEYDKKSALHKTQRKYKKSFLLENEKEIRELLKYDDLLKTHYIEPSKDDYIETYETFDKQGDVIASTAMDQEKEKQRQKQQQKQQDLANSLEALKKEFYDYKPASNIQKIFKKLEESIYREYPNPYSSVSYPRTPTQKEKAELSELYQAAINGIKKVGLKEFNKACKNIITKEELLKYLENINK
jgi:hypothetical protein